MASTIAFDIEVAGFPWEDVDEPSREYLLRRARTDEAREEVPDRMALYPCLGKVIAIGMWNVEKEHGLMLLEGDSAPQRAWDKVGDADLQTGSEEELLTAFWEIVGRKRPRLVTFNGRMYDGPILMLRSAQLGVVPSLNLVPNRYTIGLHCDLSEIFSFMGAWRERYSLDYWCRRFGVESPKSGIDGSQVTGAYYEGRIEEIGEYCLRDVRATASLYKKVESSLIPLFRA